MRVMDRVVNLNIPAKPEYVVICRLALAGVLRDSGYSDEAVADLKLALTEACSNSVRHAYPAEDGGAGCVRVSFRLLEDRVVLGVSDDGNGFDDESEVAEPLPDGTVVASEGGMGISLIRAVVDEFKLDRPQSGGTCLTLTKLRDA
jgi:serine/threonine-protein kinase RsbW